MNDVLVLLFTAGAAAFLTALVAAIKSLKSTKVESEEAMIRRLNESAVNSHREAMLQRRRADREEKKNDELREENDRLQEISARRYRIILEAGLQDPGEKQ